MRLVVALAALLILSCTYYAPGPPSDEETANFKAKMSHVHPGVLESEFLEMFPVLKGDKTREIGIVDIDRYQSTGHVANTYWLGFLYVQYQSLVVKQLVSVRCVKGRVEDIFWP